METSKYLDNNNFTNCWDFTQYIFKCEEKINLPDIPVINSNKEVASFLNANIKTKILNKARKGCLIHISYGQIEHAGYAIDDRYYIHAKELGIKVDRIPPKAIIHEVIND